MFQKHWARRQAEFLKLGVGGVPSECGVPLPPGDAEVSALFVIQTRGHHDHGPVKPPRSQKRTEPPAASSISSISILVGDESNTRLAKFSALLDFDTERDAGGGRGSEFIYSCRNVIQSKNGLDGSIKGTPQSP